MHIFCRAGGLSMRFQWPRRVVLAYLAAVTGLLLVAGPLSQVYFSRPPVVVNLDGAVPVISPAGPVTPGDAGGGPGGGPASPARWRKSIARLLTRSRVFGLDTLKGFLRVAVPALAAAEARDGTSPLPAENISLEQVILRGFEVAGGVELGKPWTLLAAELPAMYMVELPERGPLVVAIETVLPQWQYEELLAAGSQGVAAVDPAATHDPSRLDPDEPLVVLYHTHGTEAFLGGAAVQAGVNPDVVGFTPDPNRNVIRVGAELAHSLGGHGIPVLHITDLFDYENGLVTRTGAYVRSLGMLENFRDGKSLLEVYPSVRLIIDLHRDAVDRDMMVRTIEGQQAARILIVIGSRGNPHWETNYCVARQLHDLLEQHYPGISRGVMIRHDARFNQHLLPGSLLVELGSVENTLSESLVSARLLAQVINEAFRQGVIPERGQPYTCPFDNN